MIFVDSTPDFEAIVFLIMFNKRGDRLTILDAPAELTQQLGMELRATFPRKITTDRATEDGLHVFEVRKGGYGCKRTLLPFSLFPPPSFPSPTPFDPNTTAAPHSRTGRLQHP